MIRDSAEKEVRSLCERVFVCVCVCVCVCVNMSTPSRKCLPVVIFTFAQDMQRQTYSFSQGF
jgi:hypothetical protein